MRARHRCPEAIAACVVSVLIAMTHPQGDALADAYVQPPQAPAGDTYTLDAHVIGAGSKARTASACFRMTSTIAEPAAGHSSSAHFALNGGFTALRSTAPSDDIFFDGLEDCSP
jgi:hypothetical protein